MPTTRSRWCTAKSAPGSHDARRAVALDDHLSFIAGVTRVQRVELIVQGVPTLAAAAGLGDPLAWRPARGAAASYLEVAAQARLQVATRESDPFRIERELLAVEPGSRVEPSARAQRRRSVSRLRRRPVRPTGTARSAQRPRVSDRSWLGLDFGVVRVLRGLGVRRRGREAGVRGHDRPDHRRARRRSTLARLPLRALRAIGSQAPDGSLRDARRGTRSPAAGRALRRSPPGGARRPARRGRELLDQAARGPHRFPTRGSSRGRPKNPARRRALPRGRRRGSARPKRFGTSSRATTATTVPRRGRCGTGWNRCVRPTRHDRWRSPTNRARS